MYKIGEHEFEQAELQLISFIDNVEHQLLTVILVRVTYNETTFVWNLENFSYQQTYEDSDVMNWVTAELEKKIVEL